MYVYVFIFLYMCSNFSYAQVAPENILLDKCLFSYTKTYKYLKKNKAFAYARVAVGEEDYCAWTHSMHNASSAQNVALEACKKRVVDATCKIVDINDAWITEEDDFSMVIPADNTPFAPKKRIAIINEAQNLVLGECLTLFKEHLDDKGHKVFAYSIDENGNFACATTKEHQTLRKAAIVAVKKCEDQKIFMQKLAPKAPCLSFFDGKNILVKAKDFNITLDKKPNIFLSQKDYLKEIAKAKHTLFGPCLTQYKYYLRNKDHKAFYIAKDTKGNLVCGLSFDSFTISSAKKQALKKCQNTVKRKKLSAICQLYSLNLSSFDKTE